MSTIDEVIDDLTAVVERARVERSRLGYFAALYRNVTIRVQEGIAAGQFEDGARMERLDVIFARRYLDALRAYRAGQSPTRSWTVAFRMANSWPLLVVQHLLLGIHAHINLDLAIAAAETSPGSDLRGLERDFNSINAVLGEMMDDVQKRLARVSPWMGVLDRVGARRDEEIFTFALTRSRDLAWQTANILNVAPRALWPAKIDVHDRAVAALALPIHNPGFYVRTALVGARLRESARIDQIIDALS